MANLIFWRCANYFADVCNIVMVVVFSLFNIILEFQTSLQSDSDRLQRLLCSIANPEHPYSTFVWGA